MKEWLPAGSGGHAKSIRRMTIWCILITTLVITIGCSVAFMAKEYLDAKAIHTDLCRRIDILEREGEK